MKKNITIISLVLSLAIISDSLGVVDGLLAFIITGTLPFGLTLSPLAMMLFVAFASTGVLLYSFSEHISKLRAAKYRLPIRRFRNI